jgi:hypothetical protein
VEIATIRSIYGDAARIYCLVAQWLEHCTDTAEVIGSSPIEATMINKNIYNIPTFIELKDGEWIYTTNLRSIRAENRYNRKSNLRKILEGASYQKLNSSFNR